MKRLFAITGAMLLLMGAVSAFAACPSAPWVCDYFTAGSGNLTGYCLGADCFEMKYAEEARVVAADEEGDYPLIWHAWHSGELMQINNSLACNFERSGKKSKIQIPKYPPHCVVWLATENHDYIWFFASDPEKQCLGWVECDVTIYTAPSISPAQGPYGTVITIDDPQHRIEQGDEARFFPLGGDPFGVWWTATEIVISPSGDTLTGSVPWIPSNLQYEVAVVDPINNIIRFRGIGFYVTL